MTVGVGPKSALATSKQDKERITHADLIVLRDKRFGIIQPMFGERDRVRTTTAGLSSEGPYTLFSFGGRRLKFRAPKCLRRYLRVKKWKDGYLEVDADYGKELGVVEEYIDLRPVLKCLMIRPQSFLKPIRKVEIAYA